MTGEDTTSADRAAPPRAALSTSGSGRHSLLALGDNIVAATGRLGMPRWFWPEGVALLGQIAFARAAHRSFPPSVTGYLRSFDGGPPEVEHVNDVAPGTAAVLAAAAGEIPDTGTIDRLLDWLSTSPAATRTADGAWEHWPGGIWADTVYMAGMFVGQLGRVRGDAGLVDEFGRQLLAHAAALQHPDSGLYAHGSHRGETIWCFWGRANAWTALAAVEYLEIVAVVPGADHEIGRRVAECLRNQLTALAERQPAHGVWSVLVDDQVENVGILDTSAAAGIGAAMLRAPGVLDDLDLDPGVPESGALAARAALAYVDDGLLTRVTAGTVVQLVPFGYSVIRDDRPQLWGQGLALQAVAALLDSAG